MVLPRAGGAGNSRRAGVIAFHPLPLLGMEKNSPFFPGKIERALQFLYIGHHAEAALRIRMIEGIRRCRRGLRHAGFAAGCQLQKRFRCFGGTMISQNQQRVLSCFFHVVEPLGRHAVAE